MIYRGIDDSQRLLNYIVEFTTNTTSPKEYGQKLLNRKRGRK